ncbi:MAG: TIM barrel protein [Anaerolineales bacterium]|nr:TIM barrel protein [Anaerolineales bacterium]
MSSLSFRFGTVGSPKSTPIKPGGSVGAVIRIADLGLKGLELGWVRSVRVSEKTCTLIKDTAQEHDVAISVHAPYYINLNADDEEWPKSRKRLMDAAHYGYLAGATDVIFHPGSYFKKSPEEVLPIAIDRLAGCLEEICSAGNTVTLRPETMGKSAMLGSLEDTLKMSQAIEGVEPCIDFAHLHARPGDGSMNTYDEWARILDAYGNALGDGALQNLHTHLSGIEYTPKGEKKHLPVEESDLDFRALLQALKDFKCGGHIFIESPDEHLEGDALVAQKTWMEVSGEIQT